MPLICKHKHYLAVHAQIARVVWLSLAALNKSRRAASALHQHESSNACCCCCCTRSDLRFNYHHALNCLISLCPACSIAHRLAILCVFVYKLSIPPFLFLRTPTLHCYLTCRHDVVMWSRGLLSSGVIVQKINKKCCTFSFPCAMRQRHFSALPTGTIASFD